MNGRTNIVMVSRQRQLGRSCATPNRVVGLDQQNRQPLLCEPDTGGQSVRTGSYYDGVMLCGQQIVRWFEEPQLTTQRT